MSARWALAAAGFGLAVVASYALQRLGAAWVGEPPYAGIVAQEHVPFTWRVGVSVLHGAVAAALIAVGAREEAAERWLARVPWLVALVVGPAALAMLAVP